MIYKFEQVLKVSPNPKKPKTNLILMKKMKLTTAALALIATAVFSASANAANYNTGDILLGMYDTSGTVTNSYEVDLGQLSTFTGVAPGGTLTFALGSDISTVFGSSVGSNLAWDVFDTGGLTGGGGLAAKEILVSTPGSITPPTTGNTSENTAILGVISGFKGTTTTLSDPTYTAIQIANGSATSNSFEARVNSSGKNFGLASNAPGGILTSYSSSAVASLDDLTSGNPDVLTNLGTLQFDASTGVLTFTAAGAVPEPSTYALVAGGLLALLALKRRKSVA